MVLRAFKCVVSNFIQTRATGWLNGILKTGYGGTLEVQDMFTVCPEDRSEILGDRLEKAWNDEVHRKAGTKQDPSLTRGLFSIFGLQYILYSVILCIEESLKVVQPVLLGSLVNYFTPEPGISQTEAYLYAMGVSLCAILQVILYHPYCFLVNRLGMRIRIACCSVMYRKCLRLSNAGFSKTTTGQIVNLMSNDVNKIDLTVTLLPYLFIGPLQAIAVLVILWNRVGEPMLAGIAVLVVLVLLQIIMSKLFSKFREETAKYTDKRVTIMNEIIAGMRIIKMYCWENSFRDLIADIRRSEIHSVRMTSYLSAILETISRQGRYFCIYATIAFYVLSRGHFRASDLYIAVGLLNALSMNALLFVSLAIKQMVQTAVTFGRITDFLRLEELHLNQEDSIDCIADCKSKFIDVKKITAKWDESSEQPTLTNVTISVGEDQLVAVIGPVGSGKSSLLLAILKELPLTSGSIKVGGRVAYVSQQSWVYAASIRDNILFGSKFDQRKYDNILRACALDKDVISLLHGDSTLIGDRGVKLSGGQKARICLARALYMDADVYLLDDPFSAVDANVARHIFENVMQGILRHKTKVLVTHSLQFLQATDHIIVLQEGKMLASNTFPGLCNSGVDFASLIKRNNKEVVTRKTSVHSLNQDQIIQVPSDSDSKTAAHGTKIGLVANGTDGCAGLITKSSEALKTDSNDRDKEETYKTGTVNWRVYFDYLQAGMGVFKALILTFVCLAAQTASICSDWWLSRWTNENEASFAITGDGMARNQSENVFTALGDSKFNIAIYSGFLFGIFLFGLMRAILFFKVAVDAAEILHRRMFISIIRSRLIFFDSNPVGRILNRFSKDIGQIDEVLPITLFDFLQCSLIVAGMVCVAGAVNPWVFLVVIPLSVLLVLVRHYYLQTSRQIQRLEGVTRSPVFSHLSATLQGLHTIRTFGRQQNVKENFDRYQDIHTAAWFLFISLARWLAVRLDWICALFVTAVAFGSILAADRLDAGLVGFAMTYAFAVSVIFQWTVRQSTMVENQMVSVERVFDYCRLPSEAPLETDENHKPPDNWPKDGEISVLNSSLKYQENLPNTLKNVTCTIYANEKIGVIGRTGAGKTSLIAMLMRLVEFEGTVTIDDVNIQTIGLHELRNRISVIPQDPTLFTGKVRRNLDPFGEHDDRCLWHVLEAVEMKTAVETLQHGLDTEVAEGGINFSVGQRQLICLARAMLRKNKILIIDEATANVDTRTDHLIQKTIREKFAQCTVITIAHRLYTVMDSDRLMVLDQGTIKEFDIPFLLLQRTDGFLSKLVEQMGKDEAIELKEMAKSANSRNHESHFIDSLTPEERLSFREENVSVERQPNICMTRL